MPVEIREMVVRAIVPAQEPAEDDDDSMIPAEEPVDEHTRMVEECVAAVIKILEKRERR